MTSVNLDSLTEMAFIKLLQDLEYKKDYHVVLHCELERLNSILNLVGPLQPVGITQGVVTMLMLTRLRVSLMRMGMLILTYFLTVNIHYLVINIYKQICMHMNAESVGSRTRLWYQKHTGFRLHLVFVSSIDLV